MQYIVHKRFKGKTICGDVNIPALSECEEINNWIYYQGKPVCAVTSACAHQHFAINEDGNGMRRGKLTAAIQNALNNEKDDEHRQELWDRVWTDERCKKYRRPEHTDHWLWNHDFYLAEIDELVYIASLVGAKEKK